MNILEFVPALRMLYRTSNFCAVYRSAHNQAANERFLTDCLLGRKAAKGSRRRKLNASQAMNLNGGLMNVHSRAIWTSARANLIELAR